MQLDNRVALITGAGSGIGKAAALLLAKEGAKVAAVGHDGAKHEIEQTVSEITKGHGTALGIHADVSHPNEIESAVKQVIDQWGHLDIVFANAGINGKWAPIDELSPEEWDTTLDANLKGTFLTIKYTAPYLKKQGGSIIVTASVNGTRIFSNTGASAYSASKSGQVALTKMVALELAKYKVRANVICPGGIETNIDENTQKSESLEKEKEPVEYPEGKIPLTDGAKGKAEDVAQLVLFLASDASSHISGTEIWIDGAESLLQG